MKWFRMFFQPLRRFGNEYPHALSIFDLVLSIPATGTACERGFTHMKLIKSNRRSLLKEAYCLIALQ